MLKFRVGVGEWKGEEKWGREVCVGGGEVKRGRGKVGGGG